MSILQVSGEIMGVKLSKEKRLKQLCSRRPELMIKGCISCWLRKILPHWDITIVWINSHLVHPCLICSCYRGRYKPCWCNTQGFQLLLNPFLVCFQNKFLFTKFVFLCLLKKNNYTTWTLKKQLKQCKFRTGPV